MVYGCANTSLNKFPFALAKTSIQTHFHLQTCYPVCYPRNKNAADVFYLVYGCANASLNNFPFAHAKTPIQTHFHLHSCSPQTKKQHCSMCFACGQKLEIRNCVCVAWCTNVECATPPEAELQRSADEKKGGTNTVFCTVHVQCTHSALYSARHSARPQNAVSTKYFPKNDENTQERQHVSPTA